MNITYKDLIDQTYYFPTEEFDLDGANLLFHGIPLMDLVAKYGSPLKFTYLPKISENIGKAKQWFAGAIEKHNYAGKYFYCYCTKSSHFQYVLHEALRNDIHIETSSAFDINIVENLKAEGRIRNNTYVICNGFKRAAYIENIARLINGGHRKENEQVELKMLHFFINTGIRDNAYYWNELNKCLKVYVRLKKICPSLDSLNIGGGFPTKNSLAFDYDYEYMIDEIINQINLTCKEEDIPVPNIFTEFGSFTVGESGGAIYQVLYQKQQNDREKWNMIDSSFITTLPDSWAINKRFIMLPVNRWNDPYERVLLGGLTCDSDDYYNSLQDMNAIYLPKFHSEKSLYIGFFNTGAYQESIGGFGGLQHCLIPHPKHLLINRDAKGGLTVSVFSEQQTAEEHLKILGYDPAPKPKT